MKFSRPKPVFPRRTRIVFKESNTGDKRSLWDYANSNLVLWILTAVVGSFVTVIYSNQQACLRDSEQRIVRFNNAKSQLLARASANLVAAKLAANREEYQKLVASFMDAVGIEAKTKSGVQLLSDLRLEANFLAHDPVPDEFPRLMERHRISRSELGILFTLLWTRASEASDEVFSTVRPLIDRAASFVDELAQLDSKWYVTSHCRISDSIWFVATANRPTITLTASSVPDYFRPESLSSTFKAMEDQIERAKEKTAPNARRRTEN